MSQEVKDFTLALSRFVAALLRERGEMAEYCHAAIRVTDARNHLFTVSENCGTDEEQNLYAVSDLCRVDENSFESVPDEGRLLAVARNYFDI